MDNFGLVLAGGGGKGSYQIGAWRALKERGIEPSAVSGTSVGALNAALVCQDDLGKAEAAWHSISNEKMMIANAENIAGGLLELFKDSLLPDRLYKKLTEIIKNSSFLDKISSFGILSREGLESIMDDYVNFDSLKESIPLWACAHNQSKKTVKYFRLNGNEPLDEQDIKDRLMASAALPIAFGKLVIDGDEYMDGGGSVAGAVFGKEAEIKYGFDNCPITPIYDQGLRTCIAILLDPCESFERERFPNMKILPLAPSKNLGDFIHGTLDFSPEGSKWRMDLGYKDMKALLENFDGIMKNNDQYEALWDSIVEQQKEYEIAQTSLTDSKREANHTSKNIEAFNKTVILDNFEQELDVAIPHKHSLLEESNQNLLEECERNEIDCWIEDLVEKNKDNTEELESFLLDGVSCLAPVATNADDLKNKKFFARMKGLMDGSTIQAISDNSKNLARAQYAFNKMQEAMQRQNLYSLELAAALDIRITQTNKDIASTNRMIDRRINQVYESSALIYTKLRNEICGIKRCVDANTTDINVLKWINRLPNSHFENTPFNQLEPAFKIAFIANSFYQATHGKWSNDNLVDYINVINTNIQENVCIDKGQIVEINRCLYQSLARTGEDYSIPALESTTQDEGSSIDRFNLALNLLARIKYNGWQIPDAQNLSSEKNKYLDQLVRIKAVIEEFELDTALLKQCDSIESKIQYFKMATPLFGMFSSGKTSLVNKWMGKPIFKTQLAPETAIATELHNDLEDFLVIHYTDKRDPVKISQAKDQALDALLHDTQHVLYTEYHCSNPALAQFPDLIVTDMPGFESSNAAHEMAISNYLDDSTYAIICIPISEGTVKKSILDKVTEMNQLNINVAVLITKADMIKNSQEKSSLVNSILEQISWAIGGTTPLHAVISSQNNDLDEWQLLLKQIDKRKIELMQDRFVPHITNVAERIHQQLSFIKSHENLTINELNKEKTLLTGKIEDIEKIIQREKGKASALIDSITKECAGDVYSSLNNMLHIFTSELKAGTNVASHMKSAAENAFTVAIKTATKRHFEEISNTIKRYIKEQSFLGPLSTIELPAPDISLPSKSFLDSVLDFIEKIPLVGSLVKLFREDSTESKIRSQISQALESIRSEIALSGRPVISQCVELFFQELESKAAQMKTEWHTTLSLLEDQLQLNEEDQQKKIERIEQALITIAQKPEELSYESA